MERRCPRTSAPPFAFGWGARDAASITDDEAHDCLTRLADREYCNESGRVIGGKVEAFACKSLLGTMWRWAKRAKHLRTNIFRDLDVDAARKPRRRNRVLTGDEIRTLWTELEQPQAFGFRCRRTRGRGAPDRSPHPCSR